MQTEISATPAGFKRNQLVEGIALVLEPWAKKPSSELRTRIKWLLETDRALGRNKRPANPERAYFAFYSLDMPGRGAEIWFSEYEAFAVLTALRFIRHGSPQFTVPVLRRARSELERQHTRILAQDPAVLFDQEEIRRQAKPGIIVIGNTDPTFFAVSWAKSEGNSERNDFALCRGQVELIAFYRSHGVGRTFVTYDIVNSVHDLHAALAKTRPRKRGTPSE